MSHAKARPFFEEAVDYLVYKTLKVSCRYKEHRDFYDATHMMTDVFNEDTLKSLIEELVVDNSHITRKIYQTIGYLLFDVYNLPANADSGEIKEAVDTEIGFDDLFKRWLENF